MPVSRFSVSLEKELLDELDEYVGKNHFANRSQALRHLIENNIVKEKWQCNKIVAGAIVMIYDHHKREIDLRSNTIQHDYHDVILSSQHYHLSHEVCLDIVAVKGEAVRLTELSDKLIGIKGIRHGKLVMSKGS
jgi:CopG family nickel-responsive transcriptional regulator